jgi:hypothetical protein
MAAAKTKTRDLKLRRDLPVATPTDLGSDATRDLLSERGAHHGDGRRRGAR